MKLVIYFDVIIVIQLLYFRFNRCEMKAGWAGKSSQMTKSLFTYQNLSFLVSLIDFMFNNIKVLNTNNRHK